MTPLQFITKHVGAATPAEVIAYAKSDKSGFDTLKAWAREEMTAKGIDITEG